MVLTSVISMMEPFLYTLAGLAQEVMGGGGTANPGSGLQTSGGLTAS